MKRLFILAGLLFPLYALFGAVKDERTGMELISPPNYSIYHEETLSVVVTLSSPHVDKIMISAESNQSSEIFRQKGRDTYCKTMRLIPGENTITVKGIGKDGSAGILSAIIYHDSVSEKMYKYPPEKYGKSSFHILANEKKCIPCHKMGVNGQQGIAFENPSDSNCFVCHEKLTTRGQGHAPAINWLCTACHQTQNKLESDSQGSKFILPGHIGKVCLTCHQKEKETWEEKRFHHMPVDAQQCTRCHNPHSSENRYYLKAKAWELCTSCHIDKRDGNHFINTFGSRNHPTRGKPDPSRPGHEIECISCHNPHASNIRSLIEGESPMGICVKCHKK